MKITVDTKEDSPDDIRKVVALLSAIVSRSSYRNVDKHKNIFEDSSPGLDILDQRSPTQQEASQPTESEVGNAFTSLFGSSDSSLNKPEEKSVKKERIEIIPY